MKSCISDLERPLRLFHSGFAFSNESGSMKRFPRDLLYVEMAGRMCDFPSTYHIICY